MKRRVLVYVRNIVISVIVLAVLVVGGGLGYTWYMGEGEPGSAIAQPVAATTSRPVIRAPKPAENVPVGVAVQSITSPVAPGSNASITIRSLPEAICTIVLKYANVPSKDSGLVEKTADDFGMVTWAWTVESGTPLGSWPTTVTCVRGEQSGVVQAELVVKNG